MASQFIVGLDIGTSSVKAVAAEVREERIIPRLFLRESSAGLRKGAIVDMAEIGPAVAKILNEIKRFSRSAVRNVYVGIGTAQVKVQRSRGIVAVSRADTEIYQDDIDRAIRASQAVTLGNNRMIVHNIIREYIIDGVPDIGDPLGLSGNRLEVESLVIDAFTPHVKNLIKAVELAGGQVGGLVLTPLASARCALSKAQKDLGVALLDIGSGTTGLCVWEENKLVGVAKLPVGASNITNDIAIGLKIPVAAAEALKLGYGHALAREINAKEAIDMKKIYPEGKGSISRRFLGDIIESRLAEIFDFINNELKQMGRAGQLAGGLVIIGGAAKMPGLTELASQELKLSTQIGLPTGDEWQMETAGFSQYLEDPEFITALGLVLWGLDQGDFPAKTKLPDFKLKGLLKYFLP